MTTIPTNSIKSFLLVVVNLGGENHISNPGIEYEKTLCGLECSTLIHQSNNSVITCSACCVVVETVKEANLKYRNYK